MEFWQSFQAAVAPRATWTEAYPAPMPGCSALLLPRHVSWQPGSPVVMERNPRFHGSAPAFARVEFRPIPNVGARVAALQAGDVDLVEIVPPDHLARFRQDARFEVAESPSNRLIFLTLDSDREDSPHLRGKRWPRG